MPRKKNPALVKKDHWWRAVPGPTQTEFEIQVAKLGLGEDDWVHSAILRQWAERNAETRYVPERLLKAWNIRAHV